MDHLHRLMRGLVGLVVCFAWSGVFAQTQPPVSNPLPPGGVAAVWKRLYFYGDLGNPQFGPGPAGAACSGIAGTWQDAAVYGKVVGTEPGLNCEVHGPRGDNGQDYIKSTLALNNTFGQACEGGRVLAQANGGWYCAKVASAVPHSCPAAGTQIPHPTAEQVHLPGAAGGPIQPVCNDGCAEVNNRTVGSGLDRIGVGDATSLGKACQANAQAGGNGGTDGLPPGGDAPEAENAAPSGDTPSPANCAAQGLSYGTVGSTPLCVPGGVSTSAVSTTSSTPKTGSTEAPTTEQTITTTAQNPDGTSTTTTTTYNSDGSHSSTVATGPGGSKGGGGAGAGGGDCTGTDCGDGGFGGTCATAFTCDGDPVQCAIAKEQHERNCYMFQPDTRPGPWADAAQTMQTALNDGKDPAWSPTHKANDAASNFDWNATIDKTATFGTSCPGDVQVNFAGTTAVVSFAALCEHATTVGRLFVAVTAIFCGFILFKGNK